MILIYTYINSGMKKSIIIDFDHTIGFFEQIIFLINIIEVTYDKPLTMLEMCNIFEYYPYIFRPKLFDIILLILYFQKDNQISFFILYTRNTKPEFVNSIISFLEKKVNYAPLFNYTLYEKTKEKNIKTIIESVKEDNINNHLLCFIDNTLYSYKNNHLEIKYIKCEDYVHYYDNKELIQLFPYHIFSKINKQLLKTYFDNMKYSKKYKKQKKIRSLPYYMYELNSSFIIQCIRDFINIS